MRLDFCPLEWFRETIRYIQVGLDILGGEFAREHALQDEIVPELDVLRPRMILSIFD